MVAVGCYAHRVYSTEAKLGKIGRQIKCRLRAHYPFGHAMVNPLPRSVTTGPVSAKQ